LSKVNELFSIEKNKILLFRFGGPMKCTPSGTVWCHLTCALWLPELKFADYVKMVRKRKKIEEIFCLYSNLFFCWFRNQF
jgi:hypothetical protein